MKVLKRLLSRITLYPTVSLSSPKDDRWAFDRTDPWWWAR